jgi:hypothetical protein
VIGRQPSRLSLPCTRAFCRRATSSKTRCCPDHTICQVSPESPSSLQRTPLSPQYNTSTAAPAETLIFPRYTRRPLPQENDDGGGLSVERLGYKSPYTPHSTPCTLHPIPYSLHPTPFTLHTSPNTLHPAPCSLHPTSYALLPTPPTLHLAPYTLHPTPYTNR